MGEQLVGYINAASAQMPDGSVEIDGISQRNSCGEEGQADSLAAALYKKAAQDRPTFTSIYFPPVRLGGAEQVMMIPNADAGWGTPRRNAGLVTCWSKAGASHAMPNVEDN